MLSPLHQKYSDRSIKNKYTSMNRTDVDEVLYIFKRYGKEMKHTPSWIPQPRSDIIPWYSSLYQQELEDKFIIDFTTDDFTRRAVLQIIHDNWDSFIQLRATRPMLDFEFVIDTGDAKAVCYRQPTYGVYEANIMVDYISQL